MEEPSLAEESPEPRGKAPRGVADAAFAAIGDTAPRGTSRRFCCLSALDAICVGLLLIGLYFGLTEGRGQVPVWVCNLFLGSFAPVVLLFADKREWWRREGIYLVGVIREVFFTLMVLYGESVSVYMVAVSNSLRFRDITLQDNVRIWLEEILESSPLAMRLFISIPTLYMQEMLVYLIILAVIGSVREPQPICVLAGFARVVRSLWMAKGFRILVFGSLVLPSQRSNCFMNRFDATNSISEHLVQALTHWRPGGGCNDLVYSGHSVMLMLVGLLYQAYARFATGSRWLPILIWFRVVHAFLRIIRSQMHLSVDVVVAAIMTLLFWLKAPDALSDPWAYLERKPDQLPPSQRGGSDVGGDRHRTGCTRRAVFWTTSLVTMASIGISFTIMNPDESGPMSQLNLDRVRAIELANTSRTGAGEQPSSGGLFCVNLRLKNDARLAFAEAARSTWGRHCDGMLLWDEDREEIAPLVADMSAEEPQGVAARTDQWLRFRRLVRHIVAKRADEYQWFLVAYDSTFIVPENARRFIAFAERKLEAGEPTFLRFDGHGILMNRKAVIDLGFALNGQGGNGCSRPSAPRPNYEPQAFDKAKSCLQLRGVKEFPPGGALDVELGCVGSAEVSLNLKTINEEPCRHAIALIFMPRASWMHEIEDILHGPRSLSSSA